MESKTTTPTTQFNARKPISTNNSTSTIKMTAPSTNFVEKKSESAPKANMTAPTTELTKKVGFDTNKSNQNTDAVFGQGQY